MNFASPKLLWLLAIVIPLLALFFVLSWRKKQKLMRGFIQSRLLESLTAGYSPRRQKQKMILITAAVVLLFIALARPQFGYGWEEAKQIGIDMVIAIDTSRSMLAEDVSPNRITRAKMAVLDLLKQTKSDRLALVAFAGTAFLQCPLTLDETAFQQSLETLGVGVIPAGGSAVSDAIEVALTAFEKGNDNHKVLVLFTDGEDHDSEADAAAEKAANSGLKIFTVGVGTSEGELIKVTDETGAQTFLKDQTGNVVKSRLNETLLQHIATIGNGFYLPLKGAQPMEVLYNRGLAPLPRGEASAKVVRVYKERYHWPLGLAILILALELLWPETRKQSKTVLAFLLLLLLPASGFASPADAYKKYKAGNYGEALQEYERLARKNTNDFRLQFNTGAAAYQAENFKKALEYFNQATLSPDLKLQQQGYYNSGNTYFQLGNEETDANGKKKWWQQALTNYSHSLKLNPQDADASNNLQYVRQQLQLLEEQQKQQQQQQQQNQNQDDKNQDKQDQQQNQKNDQKNQDQQQKDQQQQNQSEKEDQQNQKEQNQKDQQKQQQQQQQQGSQQDQSNPQSQGDKQQQQAQSGEQKKPGEQESEEAASVALGKMTAEQAFRVLETQRQEERTLLFQPPQKRDQKPRSVKDW